MLGYFGAYFNIDLVNCLSCLTRVILYYFAYDIRKGFNIHMHSAKGCMTQISGSPSGKFMYFFCRASLQKNGNSYHCIAVFDLCDLSTLALHQHPLPLYHPFRDESK